MINAWAETVGERPRFRSVLMRKRCLIPANSFYEWQRDSAGRRPVRIRLASEEPFAFAGLWDAWRKSQGEFVKSCAIITTEANELVRPIHDRMPVILPEDVESLWLDEELQDAAALVSLLGPYPSERMETYEVSTLVNSAFNEGPELIAPPATRKAHLAPDEGPMPRKPHTLVPACYTRLRRAADAAAYGPMKAISFRSEVKHGEKGDPHPWQLAHRSAHPPG